MNPETSPFESFNARALTPTQVARGFVPPAAFSKLCKRRHSIIAGPRGSGKTTLLKMLQVSALRSWKHPDANKTRDQIDFTGVFIPTDRTWSEQLAAIRQGTLSAEQADALGIGAFTTQTLRALVSAVMERTSEDTGIAAPTFRYLKLEPDAEITLCTRAGEAWRLDLVAPTLHGLRSSLTKRMMEIHEIASTCAFLTGDQRNAFIAKQSFLHLNFLSAVPFFLDVLEEVTGAKDEKWALLFDELELAPTSIRAILSQAIRSVDSRLLFKLSLAPFSKEFTESATAASETNDYQLIKLWYASKEEGYAFSRSLVQQVFQNRNMPSDPVKVFGSTLGERPKNQKKEEYVRAQSFRNLADRDPSFRKYLLSQGVSLDRISLPGESQQAAALRKVVAIVAARETYMKGPEGLRSRKAMRLYCGIPALLAISEGNPRWLIGLVDALLDSASGQAKVPLHVQDQELNRLISRFSAYLRTIPVSPLSDKSPANVYALVDQIGSALTREILGKEFNPDPVGTFTVDSHTSPDRLAALELAVYSGAVVFVPESENEIATGSLRGKRFRLSYLLAPKYKLPLVLLRSKSLDALLSNGRMQEGLFK